MENRLAAFHGMLEVEKNTVLTLEQKLLSCLKKRKT
jgi:hypothetical protein